MDLITGMSRERDKLYEAIVEADFCISQALQCEPGQSRDAIIRITHEILRGALDDKVSTKLIDL